jgi:hypothetical protein
VPGAEPGVNGSSNFGSGQKKQEAASRAVERIPFETSRLMDFFSEKELVTQSGHQRSEWPLVVLKELADNAADACEDASVPPQISVTVDQAGITVADNGPGIPPEVVAGVLKFDRRISSREAYVAPCRGAQGNALKVLAAMSFVLSDNKAGRTRIEARGIWHEIAVGVDRISQLPVISHQTEDRKIKTGTSVTVEWPDRASSIVDDQKSRFLLLADDYTWLNPHLSVESNWHSERSEVDAANPEWQKWLPGWPSSAHWYGIEQFDRLAAAYLSHPSCGPQMPLGDFLKLFDGFSGSAKRKLVTDEGRWTRQSLGVLVAGRDGLDRNVTERLLAALKKHSRPVKPTVLGVIGRHHWLQKCTALGCDADTFKYKKLVRTDDHIPWIAEVAFAVRGDDYDGARIITGINWSPTIPGNDPFKDLGDSNNLRGLLSDQRIDSDSPIVLVVHVAIPRAQFLDRGKGRCDLGDRGPLIGELIKGVTADWARQMRREEREAQARLNRRAALVRSRTVSQTEAAFEVMEEAYNKTSSGGRLPVKPRQIYYAARPQILSRTGKSSIDGQYFSQTLLVRYVRENPETTADWDIVWDARGHFTEPHTGRTLPLGTLEARNYLAEISRAGIEGSSIPLFSLEYPTCGPRHRYQAILFCEKEGFDPLFERTKLAERFDLAIMSTKGMSVTAARMLIDRLCGEFDIPILIIRDFDKAGFSIAKTLVSEGPRYRFENRITAIDLGLRLSDVQKHQLLSEPVVYGRAGGRKAQKDPRENLRKNGATEEEIAFLCREREAPWEPWKGERVELNAFISAGLIGWIESKLSLHGIKKVVPSSADLKAAYRWMLERRTVNERLLEVAREARDAATRTKVPAGLHRQIWDALGQNPSATWDSVLASIVGGGQARV